MDVNKVTENKKKGQKETFFSAVHVILRPEYTVILQLKSVKLHTVLEQLQLTFR